jgi:hypothetical protein
MLDPFGPPVPPVDAIRIGYRIGFRIGIREPVAASTERLRLEGTS